MPTVIFMGLPPPACGSSPLTVRGAVPTWRCSSSPRPLPKAEPIRLFNYGHMRRDFTYIDDVVEAVERVIARVPVKTDAGPGGELDPAVSAAPWRIYNIGNNRSVEISRVVELLEQEFDRKAKIELVPMQPGDVPDTCADVDDLMRDVGFRPSTPIEQGVRNFVAWYRDYHRR